MFNFKFNLDCIFNKLVSAFRRYGKSMVAVSAYLTLKLILLLNDVVSIVVPDGN